MRRFYIRTYGCQMNERESEALAALLESLGYQAAEREEDADLYLMNTCSVREQAERKAIGKMGLLKRLKRERPSLRLGIVGCMAQRLGEGLFRELPHLDFVLGTDRLQRLPEALERLERGEERVCLTGTGLDMADELHGHRGGGAFGMISVMRGCNQFCTYCIVPYTRGRERSRPLEAIVAEAEEMAAAGAREVLLLGQNITAYGIAEARRNGSYDPERSPFADLLTALNDVEGLRRIRFTSPHVKYMNRHFMETVCGLPKVCKSFHVPLQSGSDRMLRLMNRNYTAGEYRERIAAMRSLCPELTFSTDVIVGFCGETEGDFALTRDLLEEVGFDMSYIFRYSPRKGTRAAETLADDVPDQVKRERNRILLDDLARRVEIRNRAYQGTVVEVLAEGVSRRNRDRWTGRTGDGKVCNFLPREGLAPGDLVRLRIRSTTASSLLGEIVPEPADQ